MKTTNQIDLAHIEEILTRYAADIAKIGSFHVESVAQPGDYDILVRADDQNYRPLYAAIDALGFLPDYGIDYDCAFESFKLHGINLTVNVILVQSHEMFWTSVAAQRIVQHQNLGDKEDRVEIFQVAKGLI